jgi:hypothetical protein
LRQLGAGIEERLLFERERWAGWCPMTAASSAGTPLILLVLALGISFLSAAGSIAAVLTARANVQRQIRVTAREAWMREFREQIAAFHANDAAIEGLAIDRAAYSDERMHELLAARSRADSIIRLLIAERGRYSNFIDNLERQYGSHPGDMVAFFPAAEEILRRERAAIEAPGMWGARLRSVLDTARWSRFVAWCRRDPPRFPT